MLPEYSRDPCRPGGEAVPVAGGDRYQRGVDIAGAACGPLARAIIDDGCEAAVDHAPAVEGHLGAHRLHARVAHDLLVGGVARSEEHTSELQSLMRLSYAVFCLKTKNN